MPYTIERVNVYTGTIEDKPGGLASVLEALNDAGANLEFVIAYREAGKKGKGTVFLGPLKGSSQLRAAKKAGLSKDKNLHKLRVEGTDKAGLGAQITSALADAGINMRGLSASATRKRCVVYIAFDSSQDATKARNVLKKTLKIK